MNYARRQQYRRLSRAGRLGLGSAAVALLGLFVLRNGAGVFGGLLLALAVVLGREARRWLFLARRSRLGARSEDEVRRVLAPLQGRGWRLRHGIRWSGAGGIDSVAVSPSGVGFVIVVLPLFWSS